MSLDEHSPEVERAMTTFYRRSLELETQKRKASMEAAAIGIMHDICSLDPLRKKLTPDNPDLLVLTVQDLQLILRRHLKGEDI